MEVPRLISPLVQFTRKIISSVKSELDHVAVKITVSCHPVPRLEDTELSLNYIAEDASNF